MLPGKLVTLRGLDPSNAETVRRWLDDPDVHRWMEAGTVPITAAAELAWYEAAERNAAAGTEYEFEIHIAEDDRLIGHCGLFGVDRFDRHGEVGIFIGDVAEQGKGFGRDAIVTLLRFAFETLGLNTVRIRAIDGNERGLGLYRSIGFADVGVFRQGRYVRGAFHDVVLLDMTRGDFDSRYGR